MKSVSRYPLPATAALLIGAASITAMCGPTALGSPRSDELTDKGIALLEAGDAAAALEQFRAAEAADGNDPQAAFFRGVTLNRLGQPEQARAALLRAVELRTANPDIDFELGWALLNTNDTDGAIERLERYTAANPDHAQAMEFLGRAYLAKGRLDEAEAKLNAALAMDPRLEPTVRVSLMLVDERRGDARAAAEHAQALVGEYGNTPLGRVLRNRTRGATQGVTASPTIPGGKPWRIVLSLGAGYTDNVVAASDDVPLPTDITGTDSAVGRFGTLLSYDLVSNDRYRLQAGYAFTADEYESQFDTSDYKSHLWYLDYTRPLTDRLTLSTRLSNDYLNIGGSSLRNTVSVRPALVYAIMPHLTVEGAYNFSTAEYFSPTAAVTDRDGETHTLAATSYWRIPDTQLTGRAGVFIAFTDTDGSDYDSTTAGGFISIAHPLVFQIDGSLTYTRINGSYDSANSFSGFAIKRDDDTDIISVELTRPLDLPYLQEQSARAYIRYDHTDNASTVAVFRYDQYMISGGIVIEF